MRTTKLRTMVAFVIALHVALVLAAGASAGKGGDSGKKGSTTATMPGFHRGG